MLDLPTLPVRIPPTPPTLIIPSRAPGPIPVPALSAAPISSAPPALPIFMMFLWNLLFWN